MKRRSLNKKLLSASILAVSAVAISAPILAPAVFAANDVNYIENMDLNNDLLGELPLSYPLINMGLHTGGSGQFGFIMLDNATGDGSFSSINMDLNSFKLSHEDFMLSKIETELSELGYSSSQRIVGVVGKNLFVEAIEDESGEDVAFWYDTSEKAKDKITLIEDYDDINTNFELYLASDENDGIFAIYENDADEFEFIKYVPGETKHQTIITLKNIDETDANFDPLYFIYNDGALMAVDVIGEEVYIASAKNKELGGLYKLNKDYAEDKVQYQLIVPGLNGKMNYLRYDLTEMGDRFDSEEMVASLSGLNLLPVEFAEMSIDHKAKDVDHMIKLSDIELPKDEKIGCKFSEEKKGEAYVNPGACVNLPLLMGDNQVVINHFDVAALNVGEASNPKMGIFGSARIKNVGSSYHVYNTKTRKIEYSNKADGQLAMLIPTSEAGDLAYLRVTPRKEIIPSIVLMRGSIKAEAPKKEEVKKEEVKNPDTLDDIQTKVALGAGVAVVVVALIRKLAHRR